MQRILSDQIVVFSGKSKGMNILDKFVEIIGDSEVSCSVAALVSASAAPVVSTCVNVFLLGV